MVRGSSTTRSGRKCAREATWDEILKMNPLVYTTPEMFVDKQKTFFFF